MIAEFVDTNLLVYAFDSGAGERCRRAVQLLEELRVAGNLAVSTQVLIEFHAAMLRKGTVTPATAVGILKRMDSWNIHRPTHADLLEAAHLQHREKISWWDALIVTSAQQLGCDTLWSEDFTHGRHFGGLTVRNPFH